MARKNIKPSKAEQKAKTITLGCRLNAFESGVMEKHASEAGLTDAVIINTCAVTNEAVRQGRQAIRRARRENPNSKIIATGCAVQIQPKAYAEMSEVDRVWGNSEKMQASSFGRKALSSPQKIQTSDIMKTRRAAPNRADGLTERARAIVQVQNGCDHRCTFCIIPFGRGNSRSVRAKDVVRHVQKLAAQGFNEIVLTGVDISSWGDDLEGQPELGSLVGKILKGVPNLPRLRISSIDSAEVDAELFDLFASEPRLTPYLHLSLQHGDNMILKRMKRRHSREDAIALCKNLRRVRPDISFGADIIAGFPTETDAMFENSLSLVQECELAWLHVFPYSARQGTPAARMPQINGAVIKNRAARLREIGNLMREKHFKSRLNLRGGQYDLALIEKGNLGRLADFSPIILPEHDYTPGTLRPMRITGYDEFSLIGEFA